MSREYCYACRRPKIGCLCPELPPMETRARIVLLMHQKEYRYQKTGTGRLACLHLGSSEIVHGVAFDEHPRVRELLDDPANFPVLLYPGPGATDLSAPGFANSGPAARRLATEIGERRLVVFLIDSTWRCSHAVIRESPRIASLPRVQFRSSERSRWIIKRQPRDYCLATIEAIHELLRVLESAGLEDYPDKGRLLNAFAAMQAYQVERTAADRRPRRLGGSGSDSGTGEPTRPCPPAGPSARAPS
jgi:DTW domain-containing protein YfiP